MLHHRNLSESLWSQYHASQRHDPLEKLNGMYIHPPLFTKVMGRPTTKRRKTPEEKKKNDGTVYLNKKGVAMHCSVCGKDDHNKRGHGKYMERQM